MNFAHDEKDAKGELLPCPFCGSQPNPCMHLTYGHYGVVCKCGASSPSAWVGGPNASAEAVAKAMNEGHAAWNRRAERLELLARQVPEWLPIDSAPKDRTELLLWREDCGQFIGSYTRPEAFPLTQEEIEATDEGSLYAEDWFTQWPQAIRCDGSEAPTHWMPLPPPPEVPE